MVTPYGETDYFAIKAGVLQGDTLAPYLFAIVLDYAMRKAIGGREEAQEMLTSIEFEAAKIGLHLNVKKTEVMHYNQEGITTIKAKNGMALKSVDNFKYLAGWMKSSEKDFEIRKALAWSACHKMKRIWSTNLQRKIKERLFVTTVESLLLYGSETWTINKVMEKRLGTSFKKMTEMG